MPAVPITLNSTYPDIKETIKSGRESGYYIGFVIECGRNNKLLEEVNVMQFGVQVNVYRTSWEAIRASAEAMDKGKWDSLWFADHFIPPGANREQEALTAFEGFSAMAAARSLEVLPVFG